MIKDLENKYFIILNKDEIIFSFLNKENKISYNKKYISINNLNNISAELENFLIDNLINIEKSLKDFIRKIYVIIDMDNSLCANLSIKYNFDKKIIIKQKVNDLLSSMKYQFAKYNSDLKIIHMFVSKSIIEGKQKNLTQVNENFKNLILEVKFECLKDQTVHNIKKIFSNYQISVERILIANYLRQNFDCHNDDIIYSANKVINGESNYEVSWINKKPIKQGFFEKFFNFFS
jgi:hypothetical protein